ncbi:hypothetical protein [Streptomyces sp. NPDC051704]|uniref:hypothetical protein n=1 Tax=Streptomyces sp. NPDC051704 TaxID=3365671 RepID=UPI00378E528E
MSDADADGDPSDAWPDQALADRLAVAPDALAIGTEANVEVSVTAVVLTREPHDDSPEPDHVLEAGLDVSPGRVTVPGCTDHAPDAARFELPAGWHRVRVSRSNSARATRAGIDSDENPETAEKIRIQVWPAPKSSTKVMKRWS